MFIRQKKNKSGNLSVQLVDKSQGKYRVLETIGCSSDAHEVQRLLEEGARRIEALTGQPLMNFEIRREEALIDVFVSGLEGLKLVGPELVLGKVFDEIGFNKVSPPLFRT